jgi:FAD/FMN-containing dehydrogenase
MAATVSDNLVEELTGTFRGELIRPGDPGYESARRVWNGAIDRRPALIARCAGTADVRTALAFAQERGLPVAIRGGGHSIPGYSIVDDGVVIDCSHMKGVHVNPASRTAIAQPGLTWGELDHETQAFGLAVTGGEVSDTGIAGLTLGGGIGWLRRAHGLTSDNLLSVDLVTADGRLLHVSPDENEELYWGVRGGGGNFGVVTLFEYRLHPVGPLLAGMLLYPLDQAGDALRFTRDFAAEAPDEVVITIAFITAPPAPFVPEALHGQPTLAVVPCYVGELEDGERALAPLRAYGPPAADLVEPTPYVVLQRLIDETYPPGRHIYVKSEWLRTLDDAAIDVAVEAAGTFLGPLTQILLHQMGGAVTRVAADATPFGGRSAAYMVTVVSVWEEGDPDPEGHVAWARDLWARFEPWSTGGGYVNHMSDEGDERVRTAYGPAMYDRLSALKRTYDPTNVFRLNQNIRTA